MMFERSLSELWATLPPAFADHLWQSTLFAVVTGGLTLVLRRNHAQARYWLWLAASVKFLVPFSLLVGLGSHLAWMRASVEANPGLFVAVNEVSQPFLQTTAPASSKVFAAAAFSNLVHWLPALLVIVWLGGFVVVLSTWYLHWRRISAAIGTAAPLGEGREVEALRRMERIAGIHRPVAIVLSKTSLEPGIFGIRRPVLLWPEGISEHLNDAHVEAIIAHEVWHVRRRDNLAAAMHMLVEAVFWFHPLVWWLGARLVHERERACDEAALELGSEPQIYAESILKTCQFCVGFSLACVSGVTGADLKKRIARIMTQPAARKLDLSKKLLLGATGLIAIAVPTMLGLLNAPQGRAESRTAKPTESVPVASNPDPVVGKAASKPKGKTCSRTARKLAAKKAAQAGKQ